MRDVELSSRWYQGLLGLVSGHGGGDYERLMFDNQLVMQLHRWDTDDHPELGSPDVKSTGNGVALWFQADHFDEMVEHAQHSEFKIVDGPVFNQNAGHHEIWLRDLDGYLVVVAGKSKVAPESS